MPGASLVLTVDVEEWFHVCGHPVYDQPERWEAFASRVVPSTERILELLDRTSSHATFFVLGWVARRHPGLVQRIVGAGHEIGCHGHEHRRVFQQTPAEFRRDVTTCLDAIERICGIRPRGYRAPWFSITRDSLWAP